MIHNDRDNQWIVFEYEWVILIKKNQLQMSQNCKLLILTTKAPIKKYKYISKQFIIIIINNNYSCPNPWWEKQDYDFGIYLKNPCKHNKQFQVKYT